VILRRLESVEDLSVFLEAVSSTASSTESFTKPLVRMMGQSIGPVFGGIISNYLGFHAIFWFLFGLGALTLLLIVLLLPETLRSIAGNGMIRLTSIHRPFIYFFSPLFLSCWNDVPHLGRTSQYPALLPP
jgi:MFS family permease